MRERLVRLAGTVALAGQGQVLGDLGCTGDTAPARVNALEQIFRRSCPGYILEECRHAALALGRAHGLASVHATTLAGNLGVGFPQHGVVPAQVYAKSARLLGGLLLHAATKRKDVEVVALGLPGRQAKLGEALRVCGGFEGHRPGPAHRGVVAVSSASWPRREPRHDHIGTYRPNGAHHVSQQRLLAPHAQSFFWRLGVAEVHNRRKVLLAPVDPARFQQLVGADHAHEMPLFRADAVLASFAACGREVDRSQVQAAGEIGHHGGVLVVRMRTQHQHGADSVEAVQQFVQLGRPAQGRGLRLQQAG